MNQILRTCGLLLAVALCVHGRTGMAQSASQRVTVGVGSITVIGIDAGHEVVHDVGPRTRRSSLRYSLTSNEPGLSLKASIHGVPADVRISLQAESSIGQALPGHTTDARDGVVLVTDMTRGMEQGRVLELTMQWLKKDETDFSPVLRLDLIDAQGKVRGSSSQALAAVSPGSGR